MTSGPINLLPRASIAAPDRTMSVNYRLFAAIGRPQRCSLGYMLTILVLLIRSVTYVRDRIHLRSPWTLGLATSTTRHHKVILGTCSLW
jgi:hypothetical protein